MVEKFLKVAFDSKGFEYEIDKNGNLVFDCGGNPFEFARIITFIYKKLEDWTYDLCLQIKIEIDTANEKVVIGL